MSTYSLQILFDRNALQQIYQADLSVVITKEAARQSHSVAWLVFQPFENNLVSWTPDYGIYASQNDPSDGIRKISESQASAGNKYIFENGNFSLSSEPGIVGSYQMLNITDSVLTMGLLQSANVNGQSVNGIVSAETVPPRMTDEVVPFEILNVFMMSNLEPGEVLPRPGALKSVRGDAIRLVFDEGALKMTIQYNPATGSFTRV